MNTAAPTSASANWESRLGFFFGVALLLMAGVSATVVGYKVKQAQKERKAGLKSAFHALVGEADQLTNSSRVLPLIKDETKERRYFVSVYQLNEWVRTAGLARSLEELQPEMVADAISGLKAIEATEVLHATSESWALMHNQEYSMSNPPEPSHAAPTHPNNPSARRVAKRYDRSFIRETEAKLYKYLHSNPIN